ncbi:MAG: hypothetical protein R2882_02550 [Gemmatimonadales bacterium]
MRILASNVQLSAAHVFEATQKTTEQVQVRFRPAGHEHHHRHHGHHDGDRYVRGSDPIAQLTKLLDRLLSKRDDAAASGEDQFTSIEERIAAVVKRIDERLAAANTGQSPAGGGQSGAPPSANGQPAASPAAGDGSAEPPAAGQPAAEGAVRFRVDYRYRSTYREAEALSFRASGSVVTDDGRRIDFSQALDLARAYARTETISLRLKGTVGADSATAETAAGLAVTARNAALGAGGAEATQTQDAAPAAEPATQQALSLGGSVLGIDLDGDGTIDPNSELLGGSGNGFAELAQFDEDGNGFIDEGDSVFSRLALVDQTGDGLAAESLASRGVGAIYTGSVATPYTVTDAANQPLAQLARSGIYLNEDGTTGIAQQVNVLV